MDNEEGYALLDDENIKYTPPKKTILRKRTVKLVLKIIVILAIVSVVGYFIYTKYYSMVKDKMEINSSKESYINRPKAVKIDDFVPATDREKGPITIDKDKYDGTKVNLYDNIMDIEDNKLENFYFDYKAFNNTDNKIETKEEYLCEQLGIKVGHYIRCPEYKHLVIHNAFFGRHTRDTENCAVDDKGEKYPEDTLINEHNKFGNCGRDVTNDVKECCNGENVCKLRSSVTNFGITCTGIHKYLHVKYHCEKDEEIKVPKFAIVMFSNVVKPNTVYEHAISEMYQYADIHGYSFFLNTKRYDNERSIYYMKLHSIVEAITYGLKTKEIDWVFWVDSDIVLTNPNVKLEAFVPKDNNIHLIAAKDRQGLNAGVFLIRVCSWSLNFMMRAISYQYYFNEEILHFSDQSSMSGVLVKFNEDQHYVIVPQQWFNKYAYKVSPNDFIIHLAGKYNKDEIASDVRKEVYANPKRDFTNKKLREEVLKYYEEQSNPEKKIKIPMQLLDKTR